MDQLIQSILLIALLFLFLGGGFWVAMSLLAIGYFGISMFASAPPGIVMSTTVWGASASWTLTALPLFIWMGEILFRTKLSEDMFQGL
ncbi:MAG: TRAP transporter large permease subunit, partial [Oceanibaculum nanhaiense]|nr:TRAP transporter large permease subunit [Oceanibaculum nanhaiense]